MNNYSLYGLAIIVSLLYVFLGVGVTLHLGTCVSRMKLEQTDFSNYTFIMPDGCTFKPCDGMIKG